jgi:hypothetical protein
MDVISSPASCQYHTRTDQHESHNLELNPKITIMAIIVALLPYKTTRQKNGSLRSQFTMIKQNYYYSAPQT